jgi:hypothetical protein
MSSRIGISRMGHTKPFVFTSFLLVTTFLMGCSFMLWPLLKPTDIAEFEIDLTRPGMLEKQVNFLNHRGRKTADGVVAQPYRVEIVDESLKDGYWEELPQRWAENKRMYRGKISINIYDGDSLFFEVPTERPTGNASYRNGIPLGSFFLPAIDKRKTYTVRVEVQEIDTLLVERMKRPKLWISKGGGK